MSNPREFFRRPGGLLLASAIAFLLLMFLCSSTPIVWVLDGRKSESYPELVFLAFGMPFGAVMVAAAGINFWLKNRNSAKAKGEPESKRV
ncbi:MAG: hypothetical protein KF790_11800 [Steroidobacteraceae bacterium]|nr:hypothetical protein [Steroidobacteraceae bacterium]